MNLNYGELQKIDGVSNHGPEKGSFFNHLKQCM